MKKIIIIVIILLLFSALSYSIYMVINKGTTTAVKPLKDDISESAGKAAEVLTEVASDMGEEETDLQITEEKMEKPAGERETGPAEKKSGSVKEQLEGLPVKKPVVTGAEVNSGKIRKEEIKLIAVETVQSAEKEEAAHTDELIKETGSKGEAIRASKEQLREELSQPEEKNKEVTFHGFDEKEENMPDKRKKERFVKKSGSIPAEESSKAINNRVALFPFENLTEDKDALKHAWPVLVDRLKRRGLEVVEDESLNSFLCEERVRATGYVSNELARKIKSEFNSAYVMVGSIISFSTDENPRFGILARIIDPSDGAILWADYADATGEDFITILDLGKISTVFNLMPRVVDMLFASLKVDNLYRGTKASHKIAVLPFKNNSDFRNAGLIAMYMFMIELLKSHEFMPIEYGDTRSLIIKHKIRRKGDLGYKMIGELSESLKAGGILLGVVDRYSDGERASASPDVAITARLIDGSNYKIIWYNSFQLSGEDNVIALDWGRIRSVHAVAYKAVSGLVKEIRNIKWN